MIAATHVDRLPALLSVATVETAILRLTVDAVPELAPLRAVLDRAVLAAKQGR